MKADNRNNKHGKGCYSKRSEMLTVQLLDCAMAANPSLHTRTRTQSIDLRAALGSWRLGDNSFPTRGPQDEE